MSETERRRLKLCATTMVFSAVTAAGGLSFLSSCFPAAETTVVTIATTVAVAAADSLNDKRDPCKPRVPRIFIYYVLIITFSRKPKATPIAPEARTTTTGCTFFKQRINMGTKIITEVIKL